MKFKNKVMIIVAMVAVMLFAVVSPASAANPNTKPLGVLSFNVLAPIWASPINFPTDMDTTLLNRSDRLQTTSALLCSLAPSLDVICLQEVNANEMAAYLQALGSKFTGAMAYNDPSWWANWLVPEIPWEPNGTAVIVRCSRFNNGSFTDVRMPDGNHAEVFTGTDSITGKLVRVQSVHLDADSINEHKPELETLFSLYPATVGAVDILAGDFNEDTDVGTAAGLLKNEGYIDALTAVGNYEPTHPWTSTYNQNQRWGRIDHITMRGLQVVAGDVLDFGLWQIANETDRIEACIATTGSDHFLVQATLKY